AVNPTTFGAALLSAFNLSTPVAGETGTASAALSDYGAFIGGNGNPGNENWPKAWLNILVFDKDYNLVDIAFQQLSSDYVQEVGSLTKAPHELLSKQVTIKQPGYVYIYVSNEGSVAQEVYFDDLLVTHVKSPVIQAEDYYPFGLVFNSYSKENCVPQDYKYNSKEEQTELGLGWLDYSWRNYDPSVGRFNTIDNFADSYFDFNPYQYGANNPIKYIDVNGDSLMLFKNGAYVSTVDDGKEEMTGFNQESVVDKDGKETFTGGQSFSFNDIDLDREAIKSGDMTLNFISQADVDKTIKDSGILKQDVISRWTYAATESNSDNHRGEGKMDYVSSDPIRTGSLNIINGVGYNYADAGNYLWGYAMGKMGYLSITSRTAAHVNAWWSAKESNGQASTRACPVLRWFENRSWGGDAAADQRAIQNGLNDSGSYWEAKWKSMKKLWE
ncbi:MAG TPA: RHS repeat-associated core domain-containing protein, partial [Cytophagales bacterium]|nr:RHS repeat-associated core domain-containing protein [Cytophagales bacterium]